MGAGQLTSYVHPKAAITIYYLFLSIYGNNFLMRFSKPLPCTATVSSSCPLARGDRFRRRCPFPPLLRTSLPEPVVRKRFAVALWVFSLNLPFLCFFGTAFLLSLIIKYRLIGEGKLYQKFLAEEFTRSIGLFEKVLLIS